MLKITDRRGQNKGRAFNWVKPPPEIRDYFQKLLETYGIRFIAGEHSLDLVKDILIVRKLPMNGIEALNFVLMAVDCVRKAPYFPQALDNLAIGELGQRFVQLGLITVKESRPEVKS